MQLPTREQCFDIMKQRLPDRMISHAMTVNKIAMFVAQRFIEAGFSINLELLDRASLLHDIGKFETLGTDLDHHIRGKEIISELGFPEVAHLASMHGQYPLENYGSWEEKILAYADGRTMHDKTVTTRERIEEWMQRCPQDVPKYPNVIKDALALAAHIEAVVDVKEIK